jgi:hypothetical protein
MPEFCDSMVTTKPTKMNISRVLGFDAVNGNFLTAVARASFKGRNLTAKKSPHREPIQIS